MDHGLRLLKIPGYSDYFNTPHSSMINEVQFICPPRNFKIAQLIFVKLKIISVNKKFDENNYCIG